MTGIQLIEQKVAEGYNIRRIEYEKGVVVFDMTKVISDTERSTSFEMAADIAMMLSMGELGSYAVASSGGGKKAAPPEENLIEEFTLIQNKQSKLSKSERDYIVKRFNKHFKIKDNE